MKAEFAEQHSEGGAERVDQDRGVGSHHSGEMVMVTVLLLMVKEVVMVVMVLVTLVVMVIAWWQ